LDKEAVKKVGKLPRLPREVNKKHKQSTKFGAGSSKARKYVYSDQLRFLSKLINERITADILLVDNMEESQVTKLNKIEMI